MSRETTKAVAANRALVDAALKAAEGARLMVNARMLHSGEVPTLNTPWTIKSIVDNGLRMYVYRMLDNVQKPQSADGKPFDGEARELWDQAFASLTTARELVKEATK